MVYLYYTILYYTILYYTIHCQTINNIQGNIVLPAMIVELDDVWKIYRVGRISYSALRGVNLSVEEGEMLAVVGPSGSGKTTLLNIVGTLDRPTEGRVSLAGHEISGLPSSRLAEMRNGIVGFIFQTFNLIGHLSIEKNVELPAIAAGVPSSERHARVRALLEELGLISHIGKRPLELSGGEQQRVAMARALMNNPKLILADEPTGNLDSTNALAVVDLLRRIKEERGVTVMLVTHNMELVKYADRVARMRDGRVIEVTAA